MKMHTLIHVFISMLMGREKGEVVNLRNEVVIFRIV